MLAMLQQAFRTEATTSGRNSASSLVAQSISLGREGTDSCSSTWAWPHYRRSGSGSRSLSAACLCKCAFLHAQPYFRRISGLRPPGPAGPWFSDSACRLSDAPSIATVAKRSRRPAPAHDRCPSKAIAPVERERTLATGRKQLFGERLVSRFISSAW